MDLVDYQRLFCEACLIHILFDMVHSIYIIYNCVDWHHTIPLP